MNYKYLLIFILMLGCIGIVNATSYYINSTSGTDSGSCTTQATACKTLSYVTALWMQNNSVLYFNGCEGPYRGYFARSTRNSNYMNYTSYGGCGNARIWGSVNASATTYWTNRTATIWVSQANFTAGEVQQIYFNSTYYKIGQVVLGNRETTAAGLNSENDFWYNNSDFTVQVYSAVNPASKFSGIEIGAYNYSSNGALFWLDSRDVTNINNLEFAFTRETALQLTSMDNVTIENLSFYYVYQIGTRLQRMDDSRLNNITMLYTGIRGQAPPIGQSAQGESIFIMSSRNVSLTNSNIQKPGGVVITWWQAISGYAGYNIVKDHLQNYTSGSGWAACIYVEGGNNTLNEYNNLTNCVIGYHVGNENLGYATNNNTFRYNIVNGSVIANVMIDQLIDNSRTSSNNTIDHNTLIKSTNISGSSFGKQVFLKNYTTTVFTNNLIYNDYADGSFGYLISSDNRTTQLTSDNNSWYSVNGANSTLFDNVVKTFTQWKALGYDANSITANPLLKGVTPAYNSPVCTASSTGSYVGAVPCAEPNVSVTISNVQVVDINSASVNITWDTDVLSDSNVSYGTTIALLNNTQDLGLTYSHSIVLTGLTRNTLYYYNVSSKGVGTGVTKSGLNNLTTQSCYSLISGTATTFSANSLNVLCPGIYDMRGASSAAINMNGNNVTIICNNTIITGNRSILGIKNQVHNNAFIYNCTLINFSYSIRLQTVNNSIIRGNNVSDSQYGIVVDTGSNITIDNNFAGATAVTTGSHGIAMLSNGYNSFISNNTIFNQQFGLLVETNSHDNIYVNNNVSSCEIAWYSLHNTSNNVVKNNYFSCRDLGIHSTGMSSANLLDNVYNETHINNTYISCVNVGSGISYNIIMTNNTNLSIINQQSNIKFYNTDTVASSAYLYIVNRLSALPFNDVKNVSNNFILASNVDNYSLTLIPGQSIEVGNFSIVINYDVLPSTSSTSGYVLVRVYGVNDLLFSNMTIQILDADLNVVDSLFTNQTYINNTFVGLSNGLYYVRFIERSTTGNVDSSNIYGFAINYNASSGCSNDSHRLWNASILVLIVAMILLMWGMFSSGEFDLTALIILTVVIALIGYLVSLMSATC